MTKAELVREVSRETGITQAEAITVVDATLKHMAKGTEKDGISLQSISFVLFFTGWLLLDRVKNGLRFTNLFCIRLLF